MSNQHNRMSINVDDVATLLNRALVPLTIDQISTQLRFRHGVELDADPGRDSMIKALRRRVENRVRELVGIGRVAEVSPAIALRYGAFPALDGDADSYYLGQDRVKAVFGTSVPPRLARVERPPKRRLGPYRGLAIRDLEIVCAVVRFGSMTRAGTAIGVNESVVSKRVAQVERVIGGALFVRRVIGGCDPTDLGAELAVHARAVIDTFDSMIERLVEMMDGTAGEQTGEPGSVDAAMSMLAGRGVGR